MTSSSNVVRSLSADELASSLTRTENAPTITIPPPSVPPHPHPAHPIEHKPKSGLLKRLRRVLRLNAQSVRTSRPDKTRPTTPRSQTASHFSPDDNAPDSPSRKTSVASNLSASLASTAASKPAPRARTWRTGISSSRNLNLATERPGPELSEPKHDSRRFISLRNNDSSRKAAAASFTATTSHRSGHLPDNAILPSVTSPAPARPNTHRSLPKRVFSSPPNLTSRTFNFGGRKKGSMAKNGPPRSGTFSTDVSEGDSDSIKKIARVMTARTGAYERGNSMNLTPVQHNAAAFALVVEGATAGRVSFTALLDAMFRLEERLTPNVKEMLIKYLGRQDNMESLIDQLTVVVPAPGDDEGVQGPGGERERYRYSYVSSMLLSNGPIQLRRSLFFNHKHLDRLVRVLGHGTPNDPVVVRSICKVLLSVLRDSPEDTVRAMGRRKDFIDALLSHIAVTGCPEVCLSMLSTVRCQAELKFGPPNKPVVGMMADSKLVKTLCDKLADAAENGPLNGTSSSTIENCSRVIVGIALRALVIPRHEINDDDSDAAYMQKFNKDLSSLDVFSQPTPILRLLDSGLAALNGHDARGYALSTALTAVRYLLVTALNGQDSSLSTIRMQLLTVNTSTYEAGIRARIPKMANVLEHARNGVVVETMWEEVENPLGVVRLKILELIVVLLQHCSEATAKAITKAEIPRILIDLFIRLKLNSLLQHFVAAIVELSFTGKFACLRRSFLIDVRILDHTMKLWRQSQQNVQDAKKSPVNYTGELLRIFCAVHDFFKHDSPEVRELKRDLGGGMFDDFKRFCEGPIQSKLKENGNLLCAPGELPERAMDNFAIDGYSSMGGSQGSLFLRPRGPGTAVTS